MAPVGFDDFDGRVWVNVGFVDAHQGYAGIGQEGVDRGEVETCGKGGPVGGRRSGLSLSRVCLLPWVPK